MALWQFDSCNICVWMRVLMRGKPPAINFLTRCQLGLNGARLALALVFMVRITE